MDTFVTLCHPFLHGKTRWMATIPGACHPCTTCKNRRNRRAPLKAPPSVSRMLRALIHLRNRAFISARDRLGPVVAESSLSHFELNMLFPYMPCRPEHGVGYTAHRPELCRHADEGGQAKNGLTILIRSPGRAMKFVQP